MEIYLYCSYEQSQKGFCLTRLAGDELVPCPNAPALIGEFFYYDRYQVLWKDLQSDIQPNKKEIAVSGGFFGLRGLKGLIQGGRWGNANIAFHADSQEEMTDLRRIALGILGDVDTFTVMLLRHLSIGGEAGYLLDIPVFRGFIDKFREASRMKPLIQPDHPAMGILPTLQRKESAKTTQELTRLAVGQIIPDELIPPKKSFWRRQQVLNFLTPEQFQAIFAGQGPLWELCPGQSS